MQLSNKQITTLKIDVEGAELYVINALLPLITQSRPIVLMEILPCYTSTNTERIQRQDALENIFSNLGYLKYRVAKSPTIATLQLVTTIGVHGNIEDCEYVIIPQELQDNIEQKFDVKHK